MSNVKNIEQYVAKNIIIELRRQNEELKKLRYLASTIEHCSVCYIGNSYCYDDLEFHYCYTCKKIVCDNCCKYWLLEAMKYDYETDYCSWKCYHENTDG